jgi:hypothetical protein
MEILIHVNDGTGETLRKMKTTHKTWEHLGNMYEPTNDAQQAHTLQALVNYKMTNKQSITEFLVTWQKKLDDTLTFGLEIVAKLQKILLLGALPPSWQRFEPHRTRQIVQWLLIFSPT